MPIIISPSNKEVEKESCNCLLALLERNLKISLKLSDDQSLQIVEKFVASSAATVEFNRFAAGVLAKIFQDVSQETPFQRYENYMESIIVRGLFLLENCADYLVEFNLVMMLSNISAKRDVIESESWLEYNAFLQSLEMIMN